MLLKKYVFFGLVLLALGSCAKDDLTRPVDAVLLLEMESESVNHPEGILEVTGGRFLIDELAFDGHREEGEDYFFTRQLPGGKGIPFSKDAPGVLMNFEMPRGVYTRIDLSMQLPRGNDADAAKEALQRTDVSGGVELWGTYQSSQGTTIPFLFIYASPDAYRFTAENAQGSQQVVVKDDKDYTARLKFSPQRWMDLINPRMLQSGKLSLVNGEPTIVISSNQNQPIYNLLVSRIEQSAVFLFE